MIATLTMVLFGAWSISALLLQPNIAD